MSLSQISTNRCSTVRVESPQRGFALVISIVFLAVLSAMAISAMRTASIDEKMAANSQQYEKSFQGAETGLRLAFRNANTATPNLDEASTRNSLILVDGAVCETATNPGCDAGSTIANTVSLDTETRYRQEGTVPPPGFSFDGPFATHHFSVSSHARHGSAKTSLEQGFRRIGPRSNL